MSAKWMYVRKWLIGVSCCSLVLGTVMMIWPQVSATALCWILGLLIVGVGIHEIARYFQLGFAGLFFRLDLVLGICDILIGVVLLPPFIGSSFLPFAAGLYVLAGSIFNIQLALNISKYKMGAWGTSLALGIVGLVLSIFLFADPFHGTAALMTFIGVSLMVNGIQGLYDVSRLTKAIKISEGPKAESQSEVIDVEWRRVE